MSLVLTNRADKSQSIDTIELVLCQFVMAAVDPQARANLFGHLEWMRRQTPDMKIDVKFETFPSTQTTVIQLAVSFAGNAPRATG